MDDKPILEDDENTSPLAAAAASAEDNEESTTESLSLSSARVNNDLKTPKDEDGHDTTEDQRDCVEEKETNDSKSSIKYPPPPPATSPQKPGFDDASLLPQEVPLKDDDNTSPLAAAAAAAAASAENNEKSTTESRSNSKSSIKYPPPPPATSPQKPGFDDASLLPQEVPQKGTTVMIPKINDDINSNQEYSEVHGSGGGLIQSNSPQPLQPGAIFVPGPEYGEIQTGYCTDDQDSNNGYDDNGIHEGDVMPILQGFLPEEDPSSRATPSSRAAPSSREERTRKRIQSLIDNAVSLRDSAVIPIGSDVQNHVEERARSNNSSENDDKEDKSHFHHWLLPLLVLVMVACIVLAIVLSVRGRGGSDEVPGSRLDDSACLPGGVDVRFALAKSILSTITSPDLLVDELTPQGKAIRWIVCDDSISVQLLENQDPSTGNLPKQQNKGLPSGLSGEAQVTRRYILATFYYSTTQDSPWTDSLNFLSPDLHECNWHGNYTRQNFPYGDFDPVGVICTTDSGVITPMDVQDEVLLEDADHPLSFLDVNFRIDNNLNGQLPPEIGYLVDCRRLMLENNVLLTGQLPQTVGNMTSLFSAALLFNGPKFGGELPSGLFQLKNVNTIHIQHNLGKQWSLPANVQIGVDTQLERLLLIENSFIGNIPSWIAQLSRLQTLDLSRNNFQGALLEAMGNLSSLKYLNLRENDLTETIPSSLGQLPQLEALILGNNELHGELPASIGNLRTLELLDVSSNELTSVIPSSFANLESLKYLVLESNRFNGTVDVLESMKNLTVLLIRSNSFSGSLPDGLMSETSDNVVIDVGDNKFTDKLPSSFANMSNLVSLIGTKNSFADNATQPAVCDNTSLLVMDCGACECCQVCCDGENDNVCDYHKKVPNLLGYVCGAWYKYCLKDTEYFANSSSALTESDFY